MNPDTLTPGTPVYAIDEQQDVVRGTFAERHGPWIVIATEAGERVFHARYVERDFWRELEDLP